MGSEPSMTGQELGPPWKLDLRRHRLELAAILVLLLWRVAIFPPAVWWRDWLTLLLIYWAASLFASRSRAWPMVTLGAMGFLLGVYLLGNFAFTLSLLLGLRA
jgi:hypothetical protein